MSQDPPGYRPPPPPHGPAPIVGQPAQPQPGQAYADPYAAERALADWANQRGLTLSAAPDVRWYQAWAPFIYLFSITRVGRELRGRIDDADVALLEAFDPDPIKQAASEDRQVICFLMSQRLRARAALRAKSGGGIVSDVSSGLSSLLRGSSAGSVLGDPTLESRFDVTVPSREEGNLALPTTLRQMLVSHQWRGILELRPGGMACAMFDRKTFDPAGLDLMLGTLAQIYRCAIT
jgi:hypothetical protein